MIRVKVIATDRPHLHDKVGYVETAWGVADYGRDGDVLWINLPFVVEFDEIVGLGIKFYPEDVKEIDWLEYSVGWVKQFFGG